MKNKDLEIEDCLEKIELIIKRLENSSISLNDACTDYKEGIELIKIAEEKINNVREVFYNLESSDEENVSL